MWLWDQHSSSPSSNAIWSTGGASRRTSSCRCHNCDRWLWVLTYAACILIDYRKMIGEYRTWLSFIASGHPKMHFICHVLGHVGQEPYHPWHKKLMSTIWKLAKISIISIISRDYVWRKWASGPTKASHPTSSLSHPWHPSQAARPRKSVFLRLHVGCGMKSSLASSLRALSPPPSQPPQKDCRIENPTDMTRRLLNDSLKNYCQNHQDNKGCLQLRASYAKLNWLRLWLARVSAKGQSPASSSPQSGRRKLWASNSNNQSFKRVAAPLASVCNRGPNPMATSGCANSEAVEGQSLPMNGTAWEVQSTQGLDMVGFQSVYALKSIIYTQLHVGAMKLSHAGITDSEKHEQCSPCSTTFCR